MSCACLVRVLDLIVHVVCMFFAITRECTIIIFSACACFVHVLDLIVHVLCEFFACSWGFFACFRRSSRPQCLSIIE